MENAHKTSVVGLGYALAGLALLSCGDAVVKSIAGEWPGTAVAALRFTLGASGLGVIVALTEGRSGFAFQRPGLQVARGTALALSTLGFFTALFVMPLAEATTIGFVSPIFAALFSLWLLKERPHAAIWPAVALGLIGVALVLRPNVAALGGVAVLPLMSAAGFALMLVLNRMASDHGSVLKMQFGISAVAATILIIIASLGHASGIPALHVPVPDWTIIARCAIVAVSATCAHALVYTATRHASAGAIAPMVYVQLLVAMALGAAFYAEYPDLTALAGAALVIAGGLYLWWKS